MKLTFIDDYELAVITDDGAVSLSPVVRDIAIMPPQQIINHVINEWQQYEPRCWEAIESSTARPLSEVTIRAPLPRPTSIVCMAVNYMENGTLKEKPPRQAFFKSSHSVIGHGDTMHLPDVPASIFEAEAELALVIGRRATRVAPEDASGYIFGYLNFVDGSARGLATGMGLSWFMKGQDDFAPLGPWITTADEIGDPMHLQVRQWNNGQLTHDYNTDDMAHDIATSLSFISANTTLMPGDVIALGTNHQDLHPLQHGDVVEQEIDGLGRLTIHIEDPLGRKWARHTRGQWAATGGKGGHSPQLAGKYAE
ncbi:MAG: fumarylacetoacetate hydrolase family protein [Proteobacteria bacterium]|jgi:2-keto-4-pentenoate hydratase/2-oxohepta-3-ene-1,7-dioic acid hydratase in catechol pathway|nr:fumarylacetoacetate hydrolase family protein [Pseudomonadota bacterium]